MSRLTEQEMGKWRLFGSRWALRCMRRAGCVLRGGGHYVGRNLDLRLSGQSQVQLESDVWIDDQVALRLRDGRLTVGQGAQVGRNVLIICGTSVHIGAGTIIANNVTVVDTKPDLQALGKDRAIPDLPEVTGAVRIDENCWIGTGAIILPGVRLGKGSVVAAGAVVTHDVPGGVMVGGVPARFLKRLGRR
jgi:acetyltransferase-like isoleucine patch superfamily enzyme